VSSLVEQSRRWWYALFLLLFYPAWLAALWALDAQREALANWPMALAMALGSYVAGSTPMGGGTVGFPVLTLLFDQPAAMGRNFAFAIQSTGMTAASLYIFSRRVQLDWRALRWSLMGSLVGTPLGVALVAPLVSGAAVKLLFATVWASLGALLLWKRRAWTDPAAAAERLEAPLLERLTALATGLVGGAVVAALTGTGVNLLLFALLLLLFGQEVRCAIATSVVLMAGTSLIGLVACAATGALAEQPGVLGAYLAAAPVVALGAPLGAWAVRRIPRLVTLWIVAALCLGQWVWTLVEIQPGPAAAALSLGGVGAFVLGFAQLARAGQRLRSGRAGTSP